ncbi:MAG: hypothetical protein UHD09_09290 [Bifidobacterium sp.]|nr:hypothetical protein [Bifidobacterium sp.]
MSDKNDVVARLVGKRAYLVLDVVMLVCSAVVMVASVASHSLFLGSGNGLAVVMGPGIILSCVTSNARRAHADDR